MIPVLGLNPSSSEPEPERFDHFGGGVALPIEHSRTFSFKIERGTLLPTEMAVPQSFSPQVYLISLC